MELSILYKLLTLVVVVAQCCSMPSWPDIGCTMELERSECMYTYYCKDRISGPGSHSQQMRDDMHYFSQTCNGKNIYYAFAPRYGNRQVNLINIAFKDTSGQNTLDNMENYDINLIQGAVSLDLSNNEYSDCPKLTHMEILVKLNVSRNSLSEAKLSNTNELKNLTEIDFSYNTINTIEVNSFEFPYRKLNKLNISHNNLAAIPDGVFYTFNEMETLDLSHNYIDTLHVLTFEGMKKLLYLNLSNNRITDINLSLLRFDKLKELDLSNNKIVEIKANNFEKLIELRKLDLSFNYIFNVQKKALNNLGLLRTLDLKNNTLDVIDKDLFFNMSALQNIDLSNNNLRTLTKDLLRGKNIKGFSIKGNYLEGSISKGTFEGLQLVTELDLSNQYLTTVEDFAFYALDIVNVLLLNNNKIQSVSKSSFKGLHSLEILDLSSNNLHNLEFDKDDLVSLRSLLLQNNQLTEVKLEYLSGLKRLQFLDLSSNKISQLKPQSFKSLNDLINFQISNNPVTGTLGEKTFDGLNILPSLDISGTLLTLLSNNSFSGMIQLIELNMSSSKISEIQFNTFSNTGNIETIDLSFNKLDVFDINTTELTNLNTLILNNNALTSLSSFSFKGLPRLNRIVLSNNNIQIVQVDAFYDQQDLRHLDLSFNPVLKFNASLIKKSQFLSNLILSGVKTNVTFTDVRETTLSDLKMSFAEVCSINMLELNRLKNLESLALSNNDVVRVEVGAFSNLTRLRKLDLSYNKIEYIQPGAFKDNPVMYLLNISHNALTTVSYGIFRGLVFLNTIDMSYNFIDNLKSERFYEVRSLSELIVDHNEISSIDVDEFGGMNLRILSIGDNPLPCDIIVNMNKAPISFTITAIRKDESGYDNVLDGVTCNRRSLKPEFKSVSGNVGNDKIFTDIRDILHNFSNVKLSESSGGRTINDTSFISDEVGKIVKSNAEFSTALSNLTSNVINGSINTNLNLENIKTAIVDGNNDTSLLMERMLKVITIFSNRMQTSVELPIPKENGSYENLIPYINKVKQDLEDSIAFEKQSILAEVESKISSLNTHKESTVAAPMSPKNDALLSTEKPEAKSFVFVEVCVGLMLVVLIALLLYTLYNSGMFIPKRRSNSTRNLPDAMENSTL